MNGHRPVVTVDTSKGLAALVRHWPRPVKDEPEERGPTTRPTVVVDIDQGTVDVYTTDVSVMAYSPGPQGIQGLPGTPGSPGPPGPAASAPLHLLGSDGSQNVFVLRAAPSQVASIMELQAGTTALLWGVTNTGAIYPRLDINGYVAGKNADGYVGAQAGPGANRNRFLLSDASFGGPIYHDSNDTIFLRAKCWTGGGPVVIDGAGVLLSSDPTLPLHAASKQYADTKWTKWTGTQAQYDAIVTKDANTLYVVV